MNKWQVCVCVCVCVHKVLVYWIVSFCLWWGVGTEK